MHRFIVSGAECSDKRLRSPLGGSIGWVQDSLGINEAGIDPWICATGSSFSP